MEIERIREKINICCRETERIYTELGSAFPTLLSVSRETDSSSLTVLQNLLTSLSSGFSEYRHEEIEYFTKYNARNNSLFEELGSRMAVLDAINARVAEVRSYSEELEIISLNAMVISIKSGDKGRAFSKITENLKLLSAKMISLSNELIQNESTMIEKNTTLKKSFSNLLAVQKDILGRSNNQEEELILSRLTAANSALEAMKANASEIKPPIREAMGGIQIQDIVRQSIDQVHLALEEIRNDATTETPRERLDQLTLNLKLLEVCSVIINDVQARLTESFHIFSANWKKVHEILNTVEETRRSFINDYLSVSGHASIPQLLEQLNNGFSDYISHISLYQRGQKTMVRDSTFIVSGVKQLRTLFDSIKPVISRLQHVRITQQIEVAKNPAIAAVKDTVVYMSELIMKADAQVQGTRKELESFIRGIEELTSGFSGEVDSSQVEMDAIKQEKILFFDRMRNFQESLGSSAASLQVYPLSFAESCKTTDLLLVSLSGVISTMNEVSEAITSITDSCVSNRDALLHTVGESAWTIHDDHLKRLAEKFTITTHKEAAGSIGGFEVEKGSSKETGTITLF